MLHFGTVDELFSTLNVPDIRKVLIKTAKEAQDEGTKLKELVGAKYMGLISSADEAMAMGDKSEQLEKQLLALRKQALQLFEMQPSFPTHTVSVPEPEGKMPFFGTSLHEKLMEMPQYLMISELLDRGLYLNCSIELIKATRPWLPSSSLASVPPQILQKQLGSQRKRLLCALKQVMAQSIFGIHPHNQNILYAMNLDALYSKGKYDIPFPLEESKQLLQTGEDKRTTQQFALEILMSFTVLALATSLPLTDILGNDDAMDHDFHYYDVAVLRALEGMTKDIYANILKSALLSPAKAAIVSLFQNEATEGQSRAFVQLPLEEKYSIIAHIFALVVQVCAAFLSETSLTDDKAQFLLPSAILLELFASLSQSHVTHKESKHNHISANFRQQTLSKLQDLGAEHKSALHRTVFHWFQEVTSLITEEFTHTIRNEYFNHSNASSTSSPTATSRSDVVSFEKVQVLQRSLLHACSKLENPSSASSSSMNGEDVQNDIPTYPELFRLLQSSFPLLSFNSAWAYLSSGKGMQSDEPLVSATSLFQILFAKPLKELLTDLSHSAIGTQIDQILKSMQSATSHVCIMMQSAALEVHRNPTKRVLESLNFSSSGTETEETRKARLKARVSKLRQRIDAHYRGDIETLQRLQNVDDGTGSIVDGGNEEAKSQEPPTQEKLLERFMDLAASSAVKAKLQTLHALSRSNIPEKLSALSLNISSFLLLVTAGIADINEFNEIVPTSHAIKFMNRAVLRRTFQAFPACATALFNKATWDDCARRTNWRSPFSVSTWALCDYYFGALSSSFVNIAQHLEVSDKNTFASVGHSNTSQEHETSLKHRILRLEHSYQVQFLIEKIQPLLAFFKSVEMRCEAASGVSNVIPPNGTVDFDSTSDASAFWTRGVDAMSTLSLSYAFLLISHFSSTLAHIVSQVSTPAPEKSSLNVLTQSFESCATKTYTLFGHGLAKYASEAAASHWKLPVSSEAPADFGKFHRSFWSQNLTRQVPLWLTKTSTLSMSKGNDTSKDAVPYFPGSVSLGLHAALSRVSFHIYFSGLLDAPLLSPVTLLPGTSYLPDFIRTCTDNDTKEIDSNTMETLQWSLLVEWFGNPSELDIPNGFFPSEELRRTLSLLSESGEDSTTSSLNAGSPLYARVGDAESFSTYASGEAILRSWGLHASEQSLRDAIQQDVQNKLSSGALTVQNDNKVGETGFTSMRKSNDDTIGDVEEDSNAFTHKKQTLLSEQMLSSMSSILALKLRKLRLQMQHGIGGNLVQYLVDHIYSPVLTSMTSTPLAEGESAHNVQPLCYQLIVDATALIALFSNDNRLDATVPSTVSSTLAQFMNRIAQSIPIDALVEFLPNVTPLVGEVVLSNLIAWSYCVSASADTTADFVQKNHAGQVTSVSMSSIIHPSITALVDGSRLEALFLNEAPLYGVSKKPTGRIDVNAMQRQMPSFGLSTAGSNRHKLLSVALPNPSRLSDVSLQENPLVRFTTFMQKLQVPVLETKSFTTNTNVVPNVEQFQQQLPTKLVGSSALSLNDLGNAQPTALSTIRWGDFRTLPQGEDTRTDSDRNPLSKRAYIPTKDKVVRRLLPHVSEHDTNQESLCATIKAVYGSFVLDTDKPSTATGSPTPLAQSHLQQDLFEQFAHISAEHVREAYSRLSYIQGLLRPSTQLSPSAFHQSLNQMSPATTHTERPLGTQDRGPDLTPLSTTLSPSPMEFASSTSAASNGTQRIPRVHVAPRKSPLGTTPQSAMASAQAPHAPATEADSLKSGFNMLVSSGIPSSLLNISSRFLSNVASNVSQYASGTSQGQEKNESSSESSRNA